MSVMKPSPLEPRVTRILETSLYVEDVPRARRFYQDVLGLTPLDAGSPELAMTSDPPFAALEIPGGGVLLLFSRGVNESPLRLPGGKIPSHGGQGPLHLAFAIPADQVEGWRARLSHAGVAVEGEMRWERGGLSLYFRDPDHNLVELATPGIWAVY
jgi:catechol 2,3-dioxygenase-like lactoylglutathione lyase family enzyme